VSKLIEVSTMQIIRGFVLTICNQANPQGASVELIQAALKPYGHSIELDDVLSICKYLEGKGLVEMETVSNTVLKISRNITHLTPKGVDVLEGTEVVSGIQLAGD